MLTREIANEIQSQWQQANDMNASAIRQFKAAIRKYHGLVITDEDRGTWFSENDAENQTPVLNERNLFGYLIAAIQEQQRQIEELKQLCKSSNCS